MCGGVFSLSGHVYKWYVPFLISLSRWMSDNDEMYSVICCVVSTTTGLVCLVLSCVAEMKAEMKAWNSIVPLIDSI